MEFTTGKIVCASCTSWQRLLLSLRKAYLVNVRDRKTCLAIASQWQWQAQQTPRHTGANTPAGVPSYVLRNYSTANRLPRSSLRATATFVALTESVPVLQVRYSIWASRRAIAPRGIDTSSTPHMISESMNCPQCIPHAPGFRRHTQKLIWEVFGQQRRSLKILCLPYWDGGGGARWFKRVGKWELLVDARRQRTNPSDLRKIPRQD
ncbi:hypothetical protein LIA77_08458 [Sarocladium implicatum]|nr:hypothetical protein LIA77_08458 [Sarocladium implicatum]